MALNRDNPVALEVLEDLSRPLAPQIDELVKQIRDVDDANSGWAKRQLQFVKSRFGKRRKKRVPWVGASNISVPLVDGIVRRWRPGITSLILDANPVAFFVSRTSEDFDPARLVEPFFTWLFLEHMDTPREVMRLTDLIASRGHAYVREGWKYQTEREARIVQADQLFPQGIGAFLQNAREQLAQAAAIGEAPDVAITDEVLVARELAAEYALDMNDEEEQPMLLQAAAQLLQGAPHIKIVYERVEHDRPDWVAVDPINTIAERVGLPEKGEFFVVIHELTEDAIARRARDGHFDERRTADLIERLNSQTKETRTQANKTGGAGGSMVRQQLRDFMDRRSGNTRIDVSRTAVKRTHLWETFCKLDINGDGILEKCVMWYSPEHDIVLSTVEHHMPFSDWPVTTFLFEPHAETPTDSRGIPEMLSELAKLVNSFHNARVDAAQIVLAPVMQKRALSADYGQKIQWRPGAMIPVQNVGDIQPIQHDLRILQGLLQEEQVNQRTAESFIGTFDATINQLNQPTERRTAAEVNAITQLAQNVFGLDARMFQVSMGRSFKKIWKLWQEFGQDEIFFRVQGVNRPVLARKSEIEGDFDISPAGTPSSTNKSFLLASMERILQIVINDQSGRFDVGALLEAYFKLIDLNLANTIVRSPEETQAAQTVQNAAAQLGLDNPQI